MKWIVTILLASLFLGGLVRLVLFFRRRTDLLPEAERRLGRSRLLALGVFNGVIAVVGFLLLFERSYDALDVLMGVAVVSLVIEVTFRKGSIT
jgi:hypothetical protein